MNPDIYSPEYQRMLGERQRHARIALENQARLHERAVARRRKAKRGGPR